MRHNSNQLHPPRRARYIPSNTPKTGDALDRNVFFDLIAYPQFDPPRISRHPSLLLSYLPATMLRQNQFDPPCLELADSLGDREIL